MTSKSTATPWMTPAEYGRTLTRGLGLNILVRDVAAAVAFARDVLGAETVHADADIGVLRHPDAGAEWMVHADHTYDDHPLRRLVRSVQGRGTGAEFRLFGLDPDACEARARAHGAYVLAESADKPHGQRECFLVDPDWYLWVPSRPLPPESA